MQVNELLNKTHLLIFIQFKIKIYEKKNLPIPINK
jgi:hypothetical protein